MSKLTVLCQDCIDEGLELANPEGFANLSITKTEKKSECEFCNFAKERGSAGMTLKQCKEYRDMFELVNGHELNDYWFSYYVEETDAGAILKLEIYTLGKEEAYETVKKIQGEWKGL
jgi:hypothetical protein